MVHFASLPPQILVQPADNLPDNLKIICSGGQSSLVGEDLLKGAEFPQERVHVVGRQAEGLAELCRVAEVMRVVKDENESAKVKSE